MTSIRLTAADFLPVVGGGEGDHFVKSRKFMRGSGLFSSIGSFLTPILKRLGVYALSRGADFINDASTSLSAGNNIKESLKSAGKKTITRVGSDLLHKVRGGRVAKRNLSRKKEIRDVYSRLLR